MAEKIRRGELMDPFTDWSFKYLFGTEENKANLIGFLNLLLTPEQPITDLEYMNSENIPDSEHMKGCVFDIICKNSAGEKFLVEMQKRSKSNFNERILYYTCSLITKMGKKGKDWNYADIKKVYSICLMNFKLGKNPKLRSDYAICNLETQEIFSDKLNIIMLQIPCLEDENIHTCSAGYEFLLYLLKQMHNGMRNIEQLKEEVKKSALSQPVKEVFYNVLDTADVASLSEMERLNYEAYLKFCRDTVTDLKDEHDAGLQEGIEIGRKKGLEEGKEEGIKEGKLETAKLMKAEGLPAELIAKITGLTTEEIENL